MVYVFKRTQFCIVIVKLIVMKSNALIAIIVLIMIALPAKFAYFEITPSNGIGSVLAFLSIIVGVFVAMAIDLRSGKS